MSILYSPTVTCWLYTLEVLGSNLILNVLDVSRGTVYCFDVLIFGILSIQSFEPNPFLSKLITLQCKHSTDVTINAYIGLLLCSRFIGCNYIWKNDTLKLFSLMFHKIYESLMQNNVSNIKISKDQLNQRTSHNL